MGLCHDLDVFETAADRTQHGVLAAGWLGDRVPEVARQAIAAHDHRTGVQADSLLADMLKLADSVAVIDQHLGREAWRALDRTDPYVRLRDRLGERAYLGDILEGNAAKRALRFERIAEFMAVAPAQ